MAKAEKAVELSELLKSDDPKKIIDGMKFENGMKLLEELVSKVEGGGLDLETSMVSFERGMVVLEYLRSVLSKAEAKLQVVQGE